MLGLSKADAGTATVLGKDPYVASSRPPLGAALIPRVWSPILPRVTGRIAALVSDAELLILDKPTTGLDLLMENGFWGGVVESRERGTTVLLSFHVMSEAEVPVPPSAPNLPPHRIFPVATIFMTFHLRDSRLTAAGPAVWLAVGVFTAVTWDRLQVSVAAGAGAIFFFGSPCSLAQIQSVGLGIGDQSLQVCPADYR